MEISIWYFIFCRSRSLSDIAHFFPVRPFFSILIYSGSFVFHYLPSHSINVSYSKFVLRMTRDPMIQVENIKMEHDNVSIQQENYLTFPQYHTDEKIFVTHTKSIVYINYL